MKQAENLIIKQMTMMIVIKMTIKVIRMTKSKPGTQSFKVLRLRIVIKMIIRMMKRKPGTQSSRKFVA